jgi:C_GCAxxG_C_C family probable redox protein
MKKSEKAISYFRNQFNCSQSVLTAFGTEDGLTEDQCLKISCGFGGGIGRQQLTCGAVSGAVMAIGMKFGKAAGEPEEKKVRTYEKTRKLFCEFHKIHGSTTCREILKGLDLNDPEDHARIKELGLFETICEKCVSDAVEITEMIIKENN